MPAANHDRAQNQLAEHMPAATEAVREIWGADAEADAAVGGDDLEDDIEDGIVDGVALELARLRDHDEQDGQHDPPQVVRQLAAELLPHEVEARDIGRGGAGEAPAQAARDAHEFAAFEVGARVVVVAGPGFVGVDA